MKSKHHMKKLQESSLKDYHVDEGGTPTDQLNVVSCDHKLILYWGSLHLDSCKHTILSVFVQVGDSYSLAHERR